MTFEKWHKCGKCYYCRNDVCFSCPDAQELVHRVRFVKLSEGVQGIPNGFALTAVCGAEPDKRVDQLELLGDGGVVTCPECLK
jgi:hypothetical protein